MSDIPQGEQHLLLSVTDAAARLGIGRGKLDQLVAAGALRRIRIGKRVLFSVDELRAYVERLETGSQK